MEIKNGSMVKYLFAVAFACALVAILLASPSKASEANKEMVSTAVKSVTVYSNGMAFVSSFAKADLQGGATVARIANFSQNALLDTVKADVSGGSIYWLKRYNDEKTVSEKTERYLTFEELINTSYGKSVAVKLKDGNTIFGKLLWVSGDRIAVDVNGKLSIVSATPDQIELDSVETKKTDEKTYKKYEQGLELYLDAKQGGQSEILLNYISSGVQWSPSYNIEIQGDKSGNGKLSAYGQVSNYGGEDWNGTVLKLAVGQPSFASGSNWNYYPNYASKSAGYGRDAYVASEAASAPSPSYSFSEGTSDIMYVYTLSDPVSLKDGEQANFKMFDSQVGYEKQNVWDSYGSVRRYLKMTNSGASPIASGTARIYENGVFMGEGTTEFTGVGRESRLSYATVSSVKVNKATEKSSTQGYSDRKVTTYEMSIKVENGASEAMPLVLRDSMNGGDSVELISSSLPAKKLADNRLEWNVDVPALSNVTIAYVYQVTFYDQYRSEPYAPLPAEAKAYSG